MVAVAALALAVAAPAAQAQGGPTLLINDCERGKFKPRKIIITCADANFRVKGLTWSSWTRQEARGRGTAVVNDCEPNCAEGTFHNYPIRLRAFRPQLEGGCVPGYVFTRLAWRFPGNKPEGLPRKATRRTVCPPSGP
jgi:hypothetical protein